MESKKMDQVVGVVLRLEGVKALCEATGEFDLTVIVLAIEKMSQAIEAMLKNASR